MRNVENGTEQLQPLPFPERVTLELTNRCNLHCTFCPRKYMELKRGDMSIGMAQRIIDELAEHAPMQLVPFFRGETLLHPKWYDILYYSQKKNIGAIQFTTNATLLNREVAHKLLDLDLDFISFSMDTIDPELYNQTRRGADYNNCLDNVLNFICKKERRKARAVVQVSAVETPRHRPHMERFVQFWQHRVNRVRIYAEHSTNGYPGSLEDQQGSNENRLPCRKPFTDMVIYWNGKAALCNHDWTRQITGPPLGDVSESSLETIWSSKIYNEIRRRHNCVDLTGTSPCTDCGHWRVYYTDKGLLGRLYDRQAVIAT